MGGCITPPQKKQKPIPKPSITSQPSQQQPTAPLLAPQSQSLPIPTPPSRYKHIHSRQFLKQYRIQQNIGTTTRVQGPKYISNYTDGVGKILRIIHASIRGIGGRDAGREGELQARIARYGEVLGLEILEDQQSNLLVLQEYCCGLYLHQIDGQQHQEKCCSYLRQVYSIIQALHSKGLVLGNITLRSFRQISMFTDKVTLIQLNLTNSTEQSMGHAYKSESLIGNNNPSNLNASITMNKSMDWQAFGYLVQCVVSRKCPIFIQHKLQYVGVEGIVAVLLKGKKIKREQLDNIKFCIPNPHVILGYTFRLDILQLIKLRKRRSPHLTLYYPQSSRQTSQAASNPRLPDQSLQRQQTTKIFQRISQYIQKITAQCQQPFIMFCSYNETIKKLKGVFVITEGEKKMEELKETMAFVK